MVGAAVAQQGASTAEAAAEDRRQTYEKRRRETLRLERGDASGQLSGSGECGEVRCSSSDGTHNQRRQARDKRR